MDTTEIQLIGNPCGQHGPYTFYKAFKYAKNGERRIMALSEFFFVKLWVDSDLVCIGELQLLWVDRNSDQVLASLRLYFLPENTPDGRMDHGEDEVLAISEKVVLRVEDLITWIIKVDAAWSWGRILDKETILALEAANEEAIGCGKGGDHNTCSQLDLIVPQTLTETALDFTEIYREKAKIDPAAVNPTVVILNYPRYCRYRATMKRMQGVTDSATRLSIVTSLGGYQTVPASARTRVLFCRDTFDYPELEGHELLCNHLAPKLKGRPRGKRKKLRSVSPVGSESNESESSDAVLGGHGKVTARRGKITTGGGRNGLRCDTTTSPRRSARAAESTESKNFVKKLTAFMKNNRTPIGRIPSIGYKELDLYQFYMKVQKLGGYDAVTSNRQWKTIFDNLSLTGASTSAATVVRRHYERFLLSYERHQKGEQDKPLPVSERRRLKSKAAAAAAAVAAAAAAAASGTSDADTSEGASRSGTSTPTPSAGPSGLHAGGGTSSIGGQSMSPPTPTDTKEFSMSKAEGKTSSLRSVRVKSERMRDFASKDKASLERCLSTEDTSSSSHPSTSSSKTPSPKPDGCTNLRDEPKLTTTIINEHKILIKVKGQDKLFDNPVKDDDRPLKELRDDHRAKLLEQVNDDLRTLRQLKEDKLQKHQHKHSKQSHKHAAAQQHAATARTEENEEVNKLFIEQVVQSEEILKETQTELTGAEDLAKPIEGVGGKTPPSIEKCAEPLTSAIAPVQKGPSEPSSSPTIAEAKTYVSTSSPANEGVVDTVTAAPPDDHLIANIPTILFTQHQHPPEIIDVDADINYTSSPTTTTVKKAKLDILKEGGLEVTPVKSFATKVLSLTSALDVDDEVIDNTAASTDGDSASRVRASVIQQARERLSNQELSISVTADKQRRLPPAMPPPTINATLIKAPLVVNTPTIARNQTQQQQPSPVKSSNKILSQPYHNGERTPPKLHHQSMSIYSPQAKTIYGDPRLLFSPPIQNMQVAAGAVGKPPSNPPAPSLDILDLTLSNSLQLLGHTPHKSPHVEITRVVDRGHPQQQQHIAARVDLTTRQGYKQPSAGNIPDVSRLGSNIEITLVGKPPYQPSKPPSVPKQHQQQQQQQQLLSKLPTLTPPAPTSSKQPRSQNHKRHHNFTTNKTSSSSPTITSSNGTSAFSGKRTRLDSIQSGSPLTLSNSGGAAYSNAVKEQQQQHQNKSGWNHQQHHMELNVPNPYGGMHQRGRGNKGYGFAANQSHLNPTQPAQQPSPVSSISPKMYSHLLSQYLPPSPSAANNSQQLHSPTPLSNSSNKTGTAMSNSGLSAMPPSLAGLGGLLHSPMSQQSPAPPNLLDPFYYQAQAQALQSAWSGGYGALPALFPLPSAEQLHFYSELIAHNTRLGLQFPGAMMMMDSVKGGATSAADGNGLKKHQQ